MWYMLQKIIRLPYLVFVYIYKGFKGIFKFLFIEEKDGKTDTFATVKGILIALFLAILIRSFLYEPFHIPSGSMKPGLKDGDFIFVSKYDFGYTKYSFPFGLPIFNGRIFFKNKPQRGAVLVFRLPSKPHINYIKRLIGLPGDEIQMKDGKLFINNKEISKTYIGEIEEYDGNPKSKVKAFREVLDNSKEVVVLDKVDDGNGDNTAVFTVPEHHYFFMGDNRDNSLDSRFKETGFVPEENLIGKARMIFLSSKENPLKFWKWHKIIRRDRFFKTIE